MDSNFIKEMAYSFGADVCGISNIERFDDAPKGFHPLDVYAKTKSIIVFGKQFSTSLFETNTNVPYTFVKNKSVELLDNISIQLTISIESKGYKAIPIPSDEPYEYWDSQNRHGRGILSLKHLAQASGIGCIGKNTLLINKKYGNRLYLGAVLTDTELEADNLLDTLCPDNCTICLKACPQSALDGTTVNQKKCREKCASVTEGGGFVYSCNICRKVCPFSKI
ncbi:MULTISPECIES: epoxyqueuosine reductase [Clostridium]|uniref:Epoxyqueuosine reductase n=1 Tax=Clostridium ragsdalei P11 TaxID=1353534 RepID=A0A1A6AI27_9CLOT|nr:MULTISPECIES: epoxyqueuosine reductase [Clostridium]OBR89673.1 epoxyqueuosine reductase [Clostridium ragsdalei P11]QXE21060.1 (Fe-S)-binding protein [Clostridium sp. 001]